MRSPLTGLKCQRAIEASAMGRPMQCEISTTAQDESPTLAEQMARRFQQSQHPNSVAAELNIPAIVVFAAFVEWRRK